MRDILLQCAGLLAIATSLIHGVLGETKVFARASIEPKQMGALLHGVWQAGTSFGIPSTSTRQMRHDAGMDSPG